MAEDMRARLGASDREAKRLCAFHAPRAGFERIRQVLACAIFTLLAAFVIAVAAYARGYMAARGMCCVAMFLVSAIVAMALFGQAR